MSSLFVDTSGWYDFFVANAPTHQAILELLSPGIALVTSTYVLDELTALVQSRHGHAAAVRAGLHVRSSAEVRIEHPDIGEESRAWALFLDRPDKSYTLTDCLSFVMMRRLALDTALATDDHFSQEGFRVVP